MAHVFARNDPRSLPVSRRSLQVVAGARPAEYEDDAAHEAQCTLSDKCPRCFFEAGFRGSVRRGSNSLGHSQSPSLAWADRFTFTHPVLGIKTWLAVAPWSQPPESSWGIGCWVCHEYATDGLKWCGAYSSLQVQTKKSIKVSDFQKHSASMLHRDALARLHLAFGKEPDRKLGAFSGVSDGVPRIDKFHLAGTVAARKCSLSDTPALAETQALGSSVASASDSSRFACAKMVLCMAEPYRQQDQLVIKHVSVLQLTN